MFYESIFISIRTLKSKLPKLFIGFDSIEIAYSWSCVVLTLKQLPTNQHAQIHSQQLRKKITNTIWKKIWIYDTNSRKWTKLHRNVNPGEVTSNLITAVLICNLISRRLGEKLVIIWYIYALHHECVDGVHGLRSRRMLINWTDKSYSVWWSPSDNSQMFVTITVVAIIKKKMKVEKRTRWKRRRKKNDLTFVIHLLLHISQPPNFENLQKKLIFFNNQKIRPIFDIFHIKTLLAIADPPTTSFNPLPSLNSDPGSKHSWSRIKKAWTIENVIFFSSFVRLILRTKTLKYEKICR